MDESSENDCFQIQLLSCSHVLDERDPGEPERVLRTVWDRLGALRPLARQCSRTSTRTKGYEVPSSRLGPDDTLRSIFRSPVQSRRGMAGYSARTAARRSGSNVTDF